MRMSLPESPAAIHRSFGMPNSVLTYSSAFNLPPLTAMQKKNKLADGVCKCLNKAKTDMALKLLTSWKSEHGLLKST